MPEKKPGSFLVNVNGFAFAITQEDISQLDVISISGKTFHLLKDHRSIEAKINETDLTGKQQVLEIEGEKYSVQIKDELDQLLDTMGYSAEEGKQNKEIKAPMPGLVLEVYVAEGQAVKEGDKLLVLVAMKMENSILAPAGSMVKQVAVGANQVVEKGQLLIELE